MLSRFARLAVAIGHARVRYLLIAWGVLLGVVLALAAAWFIVNLRSAHIADAERELRNLSLVLAEEVDRGNQGIDLLERGLIEHMRELGIDSPDAFDTTLRSFEVHQDLVHRVASLPYIAGLSLHNTNGSLVNFSIAWPIPPIDTSGRDFIKALLVPHAPKTFISQPLRGQVTGNWTIFVSQRVETPEGQLLGVVVYMALAEYFEHFFSRINLDGGGGAFALYRDDGMLLVRYPHADPKIGSTFGESENYHRILGAMDHGITRVTSVMDGKDRLVAAQHVAHYPLIVTASNTVKAILAPWRREARISIGAIAFLELLIAGTVVLGVRHVRGYEALEAAQRARKQAEAELALADERERGARALQVQERRFDVALKNMLQGLVMFDSAGQLLVVNHRFCELFGLSDYQLTPGMPYDAVTGQIELAGMAPDDVRHIREQRAVLVDRKERSTTTFELSSGRAFSVTHQPMDGGWLSTYEEITEQRQAEARMRHLAHHDALTDLPNRVLFREKLEQGIALVRRGHSIALLCLDLDQFKSVNDTLGHPVGDALLQAVARRLAARTRESDTVARLSGDEFAVVQVPIERPSDASAFAGRLLDLFDEPFEVAGHRIVIGTSIGIAFAPQDGLDPDDLLRSADLALYRAKVDGRGIFRLFQAEMDAQMQARRLLELDLRQAQRTGQLALFYQPLVDLSAGGVTGFEALLRWRHPERGTVPAGQFIPLAEEIGLIVPIGEWVLHQVCAAAASWPGDLRVAVNLSPAQFRSRNLVRAVTQALREANLPAARLELEITETVMLQDTEATLAILHEFRALGVRIAMDDFGTGYSSLSYLRQFPFDRIKIDQSFVRELGKRRDCSAIIRAVTGLSNDLGIATTAEGVETADQLRTLAKVGCTEVQGYLFSPAVPGDMVSDVLARLLEPPQLGTVSTVPQEAL